MGLATDWIARNVSRFRSTEAAAPAKKAEGDAAKAPALRGTAQRLQATLRRGQEVLSPRELRKLMEDLQAAADAGEVSAHYYLGQLYRRGYLGNVEPQKAVDHLLAAARGGQNSADYALAQLFSEGHGIRPQPGNAWVFAQLAQANPSPQSAELLQQLDQQLTPDQRSQAQQLLAQEKQARGSMAQGANSTLAIEALQDDEKEVTGEDSL